jgi:hypothetical protein
VQQRGAVIRPETIGFERLYRAVHFGYQGVRSDRRGNGAAWGPR